MTKTEELSRKAKYYVRTRTAVPWKQVNKEITKAAKDNSLIVVHLTDIVDLLVATDLKGKPGDIVMWIDDNASEHIDELKSSDFPGYVIGKVEEVIKKLR